MGPTDSKKDSQPSRRRAGGVLAMEDFARRKGVTKAIQECRERQDKKRTATAKALRSYRKTMKQEGYQPGQGASRKRKVEEENSNDQDTANNITSDNNDTNKESSGPIGKRTKANPFQQSFRKAEQTKQQRQQQAVDKEEREKERDQKLKERRKHSKQLRQRTAKGQPVMKHVIHDILRKLEREKEQEMGQEGKSKK
jgi:rRNA processing